MTNGHTGVAAKNKDSLVVLDHTPYFIQGFLFSNDHFP